jgi:two-component system, chemotaxis family, chemotaxis protein CheY
MHPALKVLVVDDNAKTRSMIVEILKKKDNEILECSDGMEALGEYSVHRPDWVLMEAKMGRMDGLTATSLIHRFFPKAKVMIVSQENTPSIKAEAQHVGASAFVSEDNLSEILKHIKY